MKYIRTVNGVYDIDNASKYLTICNTEQEFDNLSKKNSKCFYINTDKKVVCSKQNGQLIVTPYIKSADTIKELCDEFVSRERIICKSRLKQTCEMLLTEKADIYGAIWTDKGLIYVAKINGKGELELL